MTVPNYGMAKVSTYLIHLWTISNEAQIDRFPSHGLGSRNQKISSRSPHIVTGGPCRTTT